ncbi:MAG: hypothetical protein Q4E24_06325 [bacterium]|nr:hypothetical protein [bacterium]
MERRWEKKMVLLILSAFFLLFPLSKGRKVFGADTVNHQVIVKEKEKEEVLRQFPPVLEKRDGIYRLKEISQEMIEEEMETITKYSDVYESTEEILETPEPYIEEDGKIYQLLEAQIVDVILPETRIAVTEEEHFYGLEDIFAVPTEKNRENGHLALVSVIEEGEYWRRDVFFTVLFREYQAASYMLNGKMIPHDDERPQLEGMEEFLLQEEGLDTDTHRIYDMRWNGGTWLDEEYGLCREAAVFVERLVRDYTAVYTGEIVREAVVGKQQEMIYGYRPERGLDSKVRLTAWYEKQRDRGNSIEKGTEKNIEKSIEESEKKKTSESTKEHLQEDGREIKVEDMAGITLAALLFLFFFCGWIYQNIRIKDSSVRRKVEEGKEREEGI